MQQTKQSWQEECAEVAQECLNFWPVPQAVFDSFADLVLALGFRELGALLSDSSANNLADALARQHLDSARRTIKH